MLDLPGKRGLVMAREAQVRRRRDERKFGFFLRMGGCMTGRAAGLEGSVNCFSGRVAKGCNIVRRMPFRARVVKMVDILVVLQYYLHSSGAGEFCENQIFTNSSYLFRFSLYFFPHACFAALLPVGGRCAT